MLKMQPLLKSKHGIAESYSFLAVILPLDEVIDIRSAIQIISDKLLHTKLN
jgi:hypothetical protein